MCSPGAAARCTNCSPSGNTTDRSRYGSCRTVRTCSNASTHSFERVDPFIGTGATDLPAPEGLSATSWFPKPQVGNTHPGAVHPFGMVSACAYSGAYPTGYGVYDLGTEGQPSRLFDHLQASGITHFQQSGTGAIRKYYNDVRVTPMFGPLDDLGTSWRITDDVAEPGYYAAQLDSGIRCEVTVGPKSAVHRYTFAATDDARLVIDLSQGGLAIDHGATVPLRRPPHARPSERRRPGRRRRGTARVPPRL